VSTTHSRICRQRYILLVLSFFITCEVFCIVEGPRPRERPMRTWREVVKEDSLARNLNKEDAMDHSKWRKLIKDV